MTNLIETLTRRLDAENCVYEISNEAAGVVFVNTFRTQYYHVAAQIAAAVELEFGHQFEIVTRLTTYTRRPQRYACLACGLEVSTVDGDVPACKNCNFPT